MSQQYIKSLSAPSAYRLCGVDLTRSVLKIVKETFYEVRIKGGALLADAAKQKLKLRQRDTAS